VKLLYAIARFTLHFVDPTWSCELVHHDVGVAGAYVFYCEQGDVADVGYFTPEGSGR